MKTFKHRRGKMNFWSVIFTAVVVLIGMTLVVWIFGGVGGKEFSAQKFMVRDFHYYQIPLLRVQIWPISFQRVRGTEDELAKYVRSQRWIGDVATEASRWDIVSMDEIGRAQVRGDASILTNYLRQPGAVGTDSWLDWSKRETATASRFWPLIARLAHEELYELIPDVFETARQATSADDFDESVRPLLTLELDRIANAEHEVGNLSRAKHLVAIAQELNGKLPDAEVPPDAEVDPEEV